MRKRDARQDARFDVVHADLLRFFPDLVRQLGGDPAPLLRRAGIAHNLVEPIRIASHAIKPTGVQVPRVEPTRLVPGAIGASGGSSADLAGYRSSVNLLKYAAETLRCPDFGLRLASLQGGAIIGPMGVVMRNSNTFGDALRYVANHCHAHSLAARVRLQHDPLGRKVFVGHEILLDRLPDKRQAVELLLLLGHLNAQRITRGQAGVREVHFRHQRLSPLRTYHHYFGCEIRFDQPEDGVIFHDRDVRSRIVDPDAHVYKTVTTFIDENFTRATPLHARVRGVILQLISTEDCCKERVAAELNLHPRTLLRRLTAEGKSFEEIKDAVRRDMALGYLRGTDLPLRRIAEKIGYSEHSVLTRSCSRWFAASPREVRSRPAILNPTSAGC